MDVTCCYFISAKLVNGLELEKVDTRYVKVMSSYVEFRMLFSVFLIYYWRQWNIPGVVYPGLRMAS